MGAMEIPISLGKGRYNLELDVVRSSIPLLLSMNSMVELQMVINCSTGKVTSKGEDCRGHRIAEGYLGIPVAPKKIEELGDWRRVDVKRSRSRETKRRTVNKVEQQKVTKGEGECYR